MGTKYPWQERLEERIRASENEEPKKPAWQERLEAKIQQEKNAQALAHAQETAGSSQKAGEYIVNQVNDLIAQNTQAVTAAQQRYANRKNTPEDAFVADSGAYFETLTQQQDLLYSQANEILSYLDSVEGLFNEEWVSSIRKTVQAIQLQQAQMVIDAENDNAYWKQWENADAYKVYQDQWNYTQMLQNMDTEAEEQKRAAEYSAVETKLAELQKMRAEAHKAAMDSSLPKEQADALWAKVDRLDQRIAKLAARSDYLYMDRPAEIYKAQMFQKFGTLQSNVDWEQYSQQSVSPERSMMDALNFNEERNTFEALTEDEKKEYSYVYNKMGKEAAQEYLKYKSYAANARRMQGVQEWAQKFANDVPVLSDIASIPMNLVSGIGYLDLLGQEAQNLITGEYRPLDYNTMAMAPSVGASGIRGQRAQNIQEALKNSELLAAFGIDENTRDVLGKNAGGIYQLGMSMADSAAVAALGKVGIPPAVGTTFLAGSAATQGVRDAVARGATDEQALASGFMNGVFEWLFEKYEIDGMLGAIKDGKMGAVVKQALVEGFGEGATSTANIVADAIIMAEKSNWELLRQQYKASGMDDNMATLHAFKGMAIQVGMDTLGGMLMGGLSTGGGIAIGKATNAVKTAQNNYQVGKTIIRKAGGVEGLKNLAGSVSETATDSKVKEQIEKLAGKVTDKGGVHIANQINTGKLFSAIRDVAAQHSTEELAKNLSEKGFDTERATQIAEAVHAVTTKKATAQQVKMLGQALADSNVAQAIMEVSEKPSAEVQQVKEFAQQMTADEQIDQGGEIVNPNIQNGGTENASTYEQADADGTGSGASVLYGSGQRNVGTGTGEQTGSVAGSTETAAQRTERITGASRIKAAVARQNLARSLRLQKVSAQDIGLTKGTERRNLQVLSQENWDGELQSLAQKVRDETGKEPVFVVGEIYVQGSDQQSHRIRAAITDSQVILQADYTKVSLDQLLDHEIYHFKKAFVQEGGYNLDATNFDAILQQFSEAEYMAVLDAYLDALDGQYGLSEAKQLSTDDAYNEIVALIKEEMMADAYAGINAFGAGADKFTKAVNDRMTDLNLGKKSAQENGVRQTNGPNSEKYSVADGRITKESTEEERYEILKDVEIEIANPHLDRISDIDLQDYNTRRKSDVEPGLKVLAKKLGITNVDLRNSHIDFPFQFSGKGLHISLHHQLEYGGTYQDYVLAMSCFDELIENAVPIEVHGEKKVGTKKENTDLKQTIVLVSAFRNEKSVTPVEMEVKECVSRDSRLYMTVVLTKIEPEVLETSDNSYAENPSPLVPGPTISLQDIFSNVNPRDKRFLKYVPDGFLSEEQKRAKQDALDEQQKEYEGYGKKDVDTASGEQWVSWEELSHQEIVQAQLEGRYDSETKRVRVAKTARYSTDDSKETEKWTPKSDAEYRMDEEEYRRVRSELEARDKQWRDNFLYNELGEEGAERYKATQKMLADRDKAEKAQRDKENRIQSGEVKLDVESRATEAKRLLENKLLKTFSIPDGMRGELRAYIGGFADRIVKHGALTEDDRRRFFARMYEAGAVTIPADDYYGEARSYIKGGHIYVPGSVVADFGDDWQDIRRRAFAAGIYLTYERTDKNGNSVSGIDVWNSDLAADLPGLFDAEDTDETAILQKIIHVAEQGKDEKISLAEYVARVAKEEYTSENDVLDSLERQMRWALESFAETAKVEIQLKDRNLRRVMKERQENVERAQRAKERRELQELQQKTLKSLQWLNKNRRLAPEELREEWNRALSDIDLYAVGAANEMNWSNKYQATWKDLAEMYKEARSKDPNFHEDAEIERIISRLDNKKIADMDPAALLDLYKLATGLRTAFYNRNNVLNDEQYRIFEEVYSDSKEELTEAGKKEKGIVDRFLNREQLSAMNVLERMAGWNPNSAWYSMAKQLERGERDVRAFTVKANRILEDYLNEHKDFVMRADGQGKDAVWYTIEVPELMEWGKGNKPIFGDTVTVYMTPAQKVHMYLESKNLDNLRHMEGGRTFVVDKELYGKGKRQEALAQGRTIRLAPETVKQLVSNLTAEEMELAQVLDQYYNGFATGEINRISNVLYGYDKAMGKHYAPIYTNQNYTNAEFGTFDVTAEGVGNMKGRVQYSKNPSYNISAFDAFERNVNQTARFVGMAIPIRNWTTLMNWTEHKNSMKDTITHTWGLEHKQYIDNLLTDMQGGKLDREDVVSETGEKLLSNYISSVFGANMSIVLKQMGSIPLAGAYLGVGNVIPGQAQVERLDHRLIGKYTQDLEWRGMGYSMPETKQLKDHPNWTQNNKAVRFAIGGGAITAMDQWAASVLWPWAENKVRKENPNLEVGTQEQVNNGESPFYKKVAEEFENAVARSQSTSDQMHQGTLRKSKHTLTRMFTMFTSDSAQTYNTLRQMIGEAGYYKKSGQQEKAKKLSRAGATAVLALLLNALWGEGVNLLAALIKNKGKKYRDEDEELTAKSVLQQMGMGMLSSLSGTVVGGDTLIDLIASKIDGGKFYAPESMEVSLIQDMYNTVDVAVDIIFGTIGDMAKVAWEGGDIGKYFKQNGNDLLGRVKDAALEIASYWGIPATNVEAYLVGALKFIPGFEAVYDGWFESADKSSLSGLRGENLSIRVSSLLDQSGIEASDGTAEALAELYEGGFTGAVPGGVPSKVTIDGEEHSLNIGQQQLYGRVWADVVAESLDKVVSSDRFAEASPEIREGMLKQLYSYASEQAKASMFDDYEMGDTKENIAAYEQAGLDVADYFAVKAEGHNTDKYLEAVVHGLPEENADALMDEIAELTPMAGEERIVDVQRWRTCVNAFGKPVYQLAALASYMTDAQFQKAKAADDFGVDLSDFVKLYEIRAEYDENGNNSFSNAEYKKAIDSLRLSTQDSAVLWQLLAGTKSAKNNPYSATIGQKVIDALAD